MKLVACGLLLRCLSEAVALRGLLGICFWAGKRGLDKLYDEARAELDLLEDVANSLKSNREENSTSKHINFLSAFNFRIAMVLPYARIR